MNDANYGLGPEWGLPSDDVQGLAVRADGDVAIAPAGLQGLLNWDGETYTYLVPQGFCINHVAEDALGRLWASRDFGGGICLIDDEGSQLFTPSGSSIDGGYEVWVGTASEGVAVVTVDTAPEVPGDIDGDGVVGFGDLLILLAAWGDCAPPAGDMPGRPRR